MNISILLSKTVTNKWRRDITNKEWNAEERLEEKSLRSTLTYFKGDYLK